MTTLFGRLSRGRRDRPRGDGPGEPRHAGSRAPARLRARRGARSVRGGRDDAGRPSVPARDRGTPRSPRTPILAATVDPTLLHSQSVEGELDLRAAVMRVRLRGSRDHVRRARSAPTPGTGRSSARSPRRARAAATLTLRRRARTAGRRGVERVGRDDGLGVTSSSRTAPRDPRAAFEPGVVRRHRLRPAAARPAGRARAGASTPGGCSPGARLPAERPGHLRAEPRHRGRTSPARASRTRARCCSRPR